MSGRNFLGLMAFLCLWIGGVATAAAPPADLSARADAILAAGYPADGPGAAVIVTRGGETLYTSARGLADVETRRPLTPDTIFRLGSITKQFTASAILRLVQEGRISLDDPISRFFPGYPQPGASATVRQLLNHTSGIQSYTAIPGWMIAANTSRPHTTAEMIAVFRNLPSPTPPGQEWAYNNSGYVMLGAIIEQVTGTPWHEAVGRLTGPLGIRTIGYGESWSSDPAMARGYTLSDGQVGPAMRIHMSVPHGAGGLVGTVGDLARWANALHHGRVVSPALYTAMTTPATLAGGRTHPYGFGLALGEVRGRPTIEHGGGIFGFSTESIYIPSEDLFVAVFANSDEPSTHPSLVARRLAALALGEPFRVFARADVDARTLAPLFGIYRIGDSGVSRHFFERGGKLYTMRNDAAATELFAAGDDHFFYPGSNNWFRIVRRPDGAHVMEMHQGGADQAELATRTGDIPAEAATVQVSRALLLSYVGHYTTEEPAVDIALRGDGVLTITLTGQEPLPMRPISDTEFIVEGPGAHVVFHGENGQVDRLVIRHGGRELQGRRAPR